MKVALKYSFSLSFMNPELSVDDIDQITKFFYHENAYLINYFLSFDSEKRMFLIKMYNLYSIEPIKMRRLWNFILKYADKYDTETLKTLVGKIVSPSYKDSNDEKELRKIIHNIKFNRKNKK